MGKTINPPPSGRLDLVHYFHETSSTHADTSRDVVLIPHGANDVLLEIRYEHNNVYQPTGPGTVDCWTINRDELIDLIKAKGHKVHLT